MGDCKWRLKYEKENNQHIEIGTIALQTLLDWGIGMKREHFRKCCSCRREEEEEPHRSISGPLTESGDTTEYSFKLTNMGWGGGEVDEVGCSLGEMKYSLSLPPRSALWAPVLA